MTVLLSFGLFSGFDPIQVDEFMKNFIVPPFVCRSWQSIFRCETERDPPSHRRYSWTNIFYEVLDLDVPEEE